MKPINLNQERKAKARAKAKTKADENAVRFGRSKVERERDALRAKLASDRLSQLRREDE